MEEWAEGPGDVDVCVCPCLYIRIVHIKVLDVPEGDANKLIDMSHIRTDYTKNNLMSNNNDTSVSYQSMPCLSDE